MGREREVNTEGKEGVKEEGKTLTKTPRSGMRNSLSSLPGEFKRLPKQ